MGPVRWHGHEGYVDGLVIARVIEHTRGWRVYIRGDPLDRVDYPTDRDAMTAAERAVAEMPAPPPPKARARARRPEEYPGRPPHPGTLREPPR